MPPMTTAAAFRSLGRAAARVGLLLLAFVSAAVADDAAELSAAFGRDTIVIEAEHGTCYRFDVWVATTPAQHRRGLMFVRELPRFAGMLFVYEDDALRSMWMKNTYIPLDILFIRADGSVASIAKRTEPRSLASIAASEPVRYVLELNAGVTGDLGIVPGSIVRIP